MFTLHKVAAGTSSIGSIVLGPDGALWLLSGTGIVKIDPGSAAMTAVAPQFHDGEATIGPDGALWFTDAASAAIGRLTTSGQATEHPLPPQAGYPVSIARGPDGALWFISYGLTGNFIGRITAAGGISEFPLPTSHGKGTGNYEVARSITSGPDGALWFAESGDAPAGGRIGRMTINGQIEEFDLPTANAGPSAIIVGQDNALWFTETNANQMGRITTTGVVTELRVASDHNAGPDSLVQEPDGTIWFTESKSCPGCAGGNHLGRLTPDGKIVLFAIPTQTGIPSYIAVSPDGSLWIAHSSGALVQAQVRS